MLAGSRADCRRAGCDALAAVCSMVSSTEKMIVLQSDWSACNERRFLERGFRYTACSESRLSLSGLMFPTGRVGVLKKWERFDEAFEKRIDFLATMPARQAAGRFSAFQAGSF